MALTLEKKHGNIRHILSAQIGITTNFTWRIFMTPHQTNREMIDSLNFTEEQVHIVSRIQKQSFENGLVWGVVYSIAGIIGIIGAVCAATRWGHLLF